MREGLKPLIKMRGGKWYVVTADWYHGVRHHQSRDFKQACIIARCYWK